MKHTWQHRTHTLTREQRTAMVSAYRAGASIDALAETFGVHPVYVRVASRRMAAKGDCTEPSTRPTRQKRRPKRKLIGYAGCEVEA